MPQYAQHYLSTQQSHRLLAYKPPSASQSFISPTNITGKRSRSPSSHMYSSHPPQMHTSKFIFFPLRSFFQVILGPTSPGSTRHGTHAYSSSQNQSAFAAYPNYLPPSSVSYTNQMPRVRQAPQMPSI